MCHNNTTHKIESPKYDFIKIKQIKVLVQNESGSRCIKLLKCGQVGYSAATHMGFALNPLNVLYCFPIGLSMLWMYMYVP